jgi:hypothetical protein
MNTVQRNAPRAIETEYKGHLFRSRLEARWAVFFDECEINWKYETEGYETWTYKQEEHQGQSAEFVDKVYRYLPDFYLPEIECFVEVKGDPKALWKERARMHAILQHESPLPGLDNLMADTPVYGFRGLLLLGDIPEVKWGEIVHPVMVQSFGKVQRRHFSFHQTDDEGVRPFLSTSNDLKWIEKITGHNLYINSIWGEEDIPEKWSTEPLVVPLHLSSKKIMAAYKNARMARFEFDGRAVYR